MIKTEEAKIITPQELPKLYHPLPQSWIKAAGLLRHRRKQLELHLKKVRREWDN